MTLAAGTLELYEIHLRWARGGIKTLIAHGIVPGSRANRK
jgi:hypothetical protein